VPRLRGGLAATLARVARVLSRAERTAALLLLSGVFGLMAAQVFARYALGRPIPWSEELARLALIWLAFVGAAFVMADGRHIAVDVVSRPLGRRGRLALEWVGSVVVLAACAMMAAAGLQFAGAMRGISSPALDVSMTWWYLAAAAGFALIGVHSAINLVLATLRGAPVWDAEAAAGAPGDPGVLT